jgi:hypothetical protein
MICHTIKNNQKATKQKKRNQSMLNVKLRIMKKRNLLKFLFTAITVFAVGFANAQPYQPFTQMTGSSSDGSTDMVTVSDNIIKYVPYYVEPDDVLNDLDAAYDISVDPTSQGVYSTFSWSFGGGANFRYQPGDATTSNNAPYIEISFTEIGTFELAVAEQAGGPTTCASSITQQVQVVDEPSFTLPGDGSAQEICADPDAESIQVASIGANGVSGENLQFYVTTEVYNLDPSDLTQTGSAIDVSGLTDVNYYRIPEDGNVGSTDPVEVFSYDLAVENNSITEYTITFHGISDHISRKTDFLVNQAADDGSFNYYSSGNHSSLVYRVYPTPNTGNIYYVPNTFDQ